MSHHRFYLPPDQWKASFPELSQADTHHATHVLRVKEGDAISLFDGCGRTAEATVQTLGKSKNSRASLILGSSQNTPCLPCQITLAQAIPKAKNMDLIIQKAVELGVARIIPLLSERTVIRYDGEADAMRKRDRWQSIAIEACKQSGQNWLPHVETPSALPNFFNNNNKADLLLIASLESDTCSFKAALENFFLSHKKPPTDITIMIGPEGDFTPEENAMARESGYHAVSLGPIVLRSETAALYSLSVLAHELF